MDDEIARMMHAKRATPEPCVECENTALCAEIERLRAQRVLDNEEAAQIYDFARDKAKARERAAVVTFLREQAKQWEKDGAGWAAMNHASAMIERGLHRSGEER